ncbi:hypothetical protein Acid7E03_07720 [Acidisoma sp. 7E03]
MAGRRKHCAEQRDGVADAIARRVVGVEARQFHRHTRSVTGLRRRSCAHKNPLLGGDTEMAGVREIQAGAPLGPHHGVGMAQAAERRLEITAPPGCFTSGGLCEG